LVTEDLRSADKNLTGGLINDLADKYQRSLDIEKGDLVRFVFIQTPSEEIQNRILIIIHHLVIDGVSWRILLDDLELLLSGFKNNEKTDPGIKSSSFRQWYEALVQYSHSDELLSQSRYWEQSVRSYKPLRTDKNYKGTVREKDTDSYLLKLDPVQTQLLLQEVPRVYNTEINDILLCALALTLCEWSSEEKIVIGMEGHGRENISDNIDTSRTVGWFTSVYPVLLELTPDRNLSDAIKSVKEQLRRVPDKGIGYGVMKYINRNEKLREKSGWDIVFNYLGQLDNVVSSGKWFSGAGESKGKSFNEEHPVSELLSVNGMVQGGELFLNWSYSSLHFEKDTIIKLVELYQTNLESLIRHCMDQHKSGSVNTPSDFGLGSEISFDELDLFLNERL
jgi:non-ribosomal peptide synthase protein (TIGR01720 family)